MNYGIFWISSIGINLASHRSCEMLTQIIKKIQSVQREARAVDVQIAPPGAVDVQIAPPGAVEIIHQVKIVEAKKQKAPALMSGLEKKVDRARALKMESDKINGDLEELIGQLREAGTSEMMKIERAGKFHTSVKIAGSNGYAQVTRKNLYKSVPPPLAQELKHMGMGELLIMNTKVKLQVEYLKLEADMKAAGLRVEDYFSVNTEVVPVPRLMEKRAGMRINGGENRRLDEIIGEVQYSPSVELK
jgi:hypothetical protein